MIDLARVEKVNSMLGSHSFVVEQGDAIRRVEFERIAQLLGVSQRCLSLRWSSTGLLRRLVSLKAEMQPIIGQRWEATC